MKIEFGLKDNILMFEGHVCATKDNDLKDVVMFEAHNARVANHAGEVKICNDL